MPELDRELDVSDKIDAYKVIAVVDTAKTISNSDVRFQSFKGVVCLFESEKINPYTSQRQL
jgi:hypothetical protein